MKKYKNICFDEMNNRGINKMFPDLLMDSVHLDKPDDASYKEILYCLVNDIKFPKCQTCDSFVRIKRGIKEGFPTFCSRKCSKKDPLHNLKKICTRYKIDVNDVVKIAEDSDDMENVYCFVHSITQRPLCKICYKELTFSGSKHGYGVYCSSLCSNKDPEKYEKTFLNKKELCKSNIRKLATDSTIKEDVYCYENNILERPKCKNCPSELSYSIRHGYGIYCSTKCANSHKSKIEKTKQSNIKKYGVENVSQVEKFKKDTKRIRLNNTYKSLERYKHVAIPMFTEEEYIGGYYTNLYPWKCEFCEGIFNFYVYSGEAPRCPHCKKGKTWIESFAINIIGDNEQVDINTKKILDAGELDIYLPDRKLAFEINGMFWHSDKILNDKKYHLKKTEECIDKDIQLIHIFEDDIKLRGPIVKSRINNLLGRSERLYARKTICKEIPFKLVKEFLQINHIQGSVSSSVAFGLFDGIELVSCMTFSKPRFNKDWEWELLRFCNKLNTTVVGGASKLLKGFINMYNPKNILSYADRCWSKGKLYENLGFDLIKTSPPNYWVTKNYLHREHRIKYQKHKLSKILDSFDQELTEWENLKANGYDRIWDCGNLVYGLTCNP